MSVELPDPIFDYDIYPTSYLARASKCLEEMDPRFLFYAALEIRFFVEARQDQYLVAQRAYRKSLPKSFEIGKQGKELLRIYSLEKRQIIEQVFPDGYSHKLVYVPLPVELRSGAERLGEFLHAQKEKISDEKFSVLRGTIIRLLSLSYLCAEGNLLSPMLIARGNAVGSVQAIFAKGESEQLVTRLKVGTFFKLNVTYDPIEHSTHNLPCPH